MENSRLNLVVVINTNQYPHSISAYGSTKHQILLHRIRESMDLIVKERCLVAANTGGVTVQPGEVAIGVDV
jgi:hypothetical protein